MHDFQDMSELDDIELRDRINEMKHFIGSECWRRIAHTMALALQRNQRVMISLNVQSNPCHSELFLRLQGENSLLISMMEDPTRGVLQMFEAEMARRRALKA